MNLGCTERQPRRHLRGIRFLAEMRRLCCPLNIHGPVAGDQLLYTSRESGYVALSSVCLNESIEFHYSVQDTEDGGFDPPSLIKGVYRFNILLSIKTTDR